MFYEARKSAFDFLINLLQEHLKLGIKQNKKKYLKY